MTKKKKRKDNDNDGDGNDDNDNQLKIKICGICLDELQIDQMYSMILCSCTFCKQVNSMNSFEILKIFI